MVFSQMSVLYIVIFTSKDYYFIKQHNIKLQFIVFLDCIAKLKSIYFEKKDPVDDNEIILQKLCVKLETALRHGMKGKHCKILRQVVCQLL